MSEWRDTTLGELIEISHGFAFKGEFFGKGGNVRLVTPGNFIEAGGFRDRGDDQKSYDGPIPEQYLLDPGDVVVAMTEQAAGLLGSSGIVPSFGRWLHNQRIGRVHVRAGKADKRFVYYLFNSPEVRTQIAATATGTKVRHTAPKRILAVHAPVPNLAAQARVGGVLAAFDELIAINKRRISLLEDLARLLYREWFVRFRFPDHERTPTPVEAEIGPVPQGWSVTSLGDAAASLVDGDWIETKDQGGDAYRLLQVSNVGIGKFRETGKFRYISAETFARLRCTEVVEGDILISRMPDPIGRAWLVEHLNEPAVTAVDVAILRPKTRASGLYLSLFLNSPSTLAHAESVATGTTRKRVSRSVLSAFRLIRPPDDILDQFANVVGPMFAQRSALEHTIQRLATTRDLLLPRLVTGRRDISDIDLGDLLPTEAAA